MSIGQRFLISRKQPGTPEFPDRSWDFGLCPAGTKGNRGEYSFSGNFRKDEAIGRENGGGR